MCLKISLPALQIEIQTHNGLTQSSNCKWLFSDRTVLEDISTQTFRSLMLSRRYIFFRVNIVRSIHSAPGLFKPETFVVSVTRNDPQGLDFYVPQSLVSSIRESTIVTGEMTGYKWCHRCFWWECNLINNIFEWNLINNFLSAISQ